MKKLGMFLVMLTMVGYTLGCSKPDTPPTTPDDGGAAPEATPGDSADTTTPAAPSEG